MTDETLFLEYIEAVDRGESPDIAEMCARADDPSGFQKVVELHGSLGASIGRFKLQEQLGKGGFGTVFLATDPKLGRQVAIKMMSGRDWARNEARSLARLRHPNIVEVYEVESDYIVMEFVKGSPLRPEGDMHSRLRVLIQVADALAYAHEEGVVSRDVKPDNVILKEDGTVKLIDFSIAHVEGDEADLNITQSLVVSPAYMAPEQIERGRTGASPQSDQFAFGVMAFEYLTGTHPFRKSETTREQVISAISRCTPPRPRGLTRDLDSVLFKALEKDPKRRYRSVRELRNDLQAVLEFRPVSVSGPSLVRFLRRWRTPLSWACGLLLLALMGLFLNRWVSLMQLRSMPLENAMEVENAITSLIDRPDRVMARRIQERLRSVPDSDAWAMIGWRFQLVTGLESPLQRGRVTLPEGALLEKRNNDGTFEPIELTTDVPLGAGYYRCAGQEFRKVIMWDTPITIIPRKVDDTGSQVINGVRCTDLIRDDEGDVLFVTLDEAMRYARESGGRLPTWQELEKIRAGGTDAVGEWIGDFLRVTFGKSTSITTHGWINMDNYFDYGLAQSAFELGIEEAQPNYYTGGVIVRTNLEYINEETQELLPQIGFRIVFSTEE